jgi:hypothetical protein
MEQKDDIKALVESIMHLHETKDFEGLSAYISAAEIKAATWFTKKRFLEVCEAIENEIGALLSLDYLAALNRKTSYLTLWKATYNKTSDEVLWQIIFDTETNKIRLMHINWEHAK